MIPGTNEWDCFGAADSVNDTYKPLSAVTNPVSVTLDSTFELDTTRFSTTPNGWGIRITGNGVGNGIIISSEAGSIVTAGYEAVTVAISNSSLVLNWARSVAANVRDGFNLNTEDTGGAILSVRISSSRATSQLEESAYWRAILDVACRRSYLETSWLEPLVP